MKSAVFYGKHQLKIEGRAIPCPRDDEVLVKVMACGVCGTDVHIYEGDEGAAPCPPGTVLGHEFSGIIEAAGGAVSGFAPGDRICVDPNRLCGVCRFCKSGRGHFCERMTGIGTTVDGGFSQYCVVPQSQLYKIADTTSFIEAAMAEPVACCLHGIDLCAIPCGSAALIIGGGMIGLIMLQLAIRAGASRTVLLEPVEQKRALAAALGADLVIDPLREDINAALARAGIVHIDTVIECAGLPSTVRQALELAGRGGTVMLFGLTSPRDEIPVKPFSLFKKELTVKASFINPYTQARAVELINTRKINVSSMIHRVCGLDELKEVLADPALRAGGKVIVEPWR